MDNKFQGKTRNVTEEEVKVIERNGSRSWNLKNEKN